MRTVTTGEQAVLNSAHFATFARVLVEDADGTYQDLTDQDSLDWVHSGRIAQTIDQIVATGDFTFWRKQEGGNSLAPLDEDSTLNRDAMDAYAPLIDVGRGIRCDVATVAIGSSPSAGDWQRVFDGVIDRWQTRDDFVGAVARDAIGAEMADRWIEAETDYGTGPGRALEDVMQDILTAWTSITLYTPASPSFLVTTYTQQRSSVMDALQQLAALVGWVVQPRWDDGTSSFRLTLYEPDRAPVSTEWTWGANRYEAIPDFALDRLHIRNAISLWYTNTSGVRSQVTAEDATSITNYDRQWLEIEEPADSPIDTSTEAQDMLDTALLDLKDPIAGQEMKTLCFWPVELSDYHQFNANSVHYTANQAFGITGFRHEFSRGHVDTFIRTRGKPAGFIKPWIARGNVTAPSSSVTTFRQALAPTAEQIGDIWLDSDDGDHPYRWTGTAWQSVVPDIDTTDLVGSIVAAQISVIDLSAISADMGTLTAGQITVGSMSLNAATERLLFGAATAPLTGIGIFMGKDGADYEFRAGDPAGNFMHWDGTNLKVTGAVITSPADGSALTLLGWTHSLVFTATDNDTVSWGTGTISFGDSSSLSIVAGNTGNITVPTYIFVDTGVSTTVLQTTTTASNAVGANRILVAIAEDSVSGTDATFLVFGGGAGKPVSPVINLDSQISGTLSTAFAEAGLLNTSVTIGADGSLSGAGGGQASLTSLPGQVQVGSIATNAVVAGTIAALAVTAGKIDAGAVDTAELAALAVTAAKIAAGTITATQIAANTITANEIAANTITGAQISSLNLSTKTLTADAGTIAGWTLSGNDLTSGSVTISAANERILMGSATAPLTGTGIFIGKDGADYEFRAGNPAGEYVHWNGSNMAIGGCIRWLAGADAAFYDSAATLRGRISANNAQASIDATGSWRFTGNLVATGNLFRIEGIGPKQEWEETDAATDAGIWDLVAAAALMRFRVVNDARSSTEDIFTVSRSGATVNLVHFGNGTFRVDGNTGIGQAPGTRALEVTEADSSTEVAIFTQTHASAPIGLLVDFSAAAPNNTARYFLKMDDSAGLQAVIYSDGSYQGSANSYGGLSDIRLKQNIVRAESNWDLYKRLKWADFEFRATPDTTRHGLVAQDVLDIFPDCVYEDGVTGMYAINYMGIATETGKAVQECMVRIEAGEDWRYKAEARIEELEDEVERLRAA